MPHEGEVQPDDSSLARRGLSWTLASLIVLAVAQVAYTSATARLVDPAEFGFYASALSFAALAGYASMASLGSAVMRHPTGHGLRRTSILLSLLTGCLAGAVVAALAGPWAHLWHLPGAAPAVRLAGLTVALGPLTAVLTGLQRRNLRFRHAAVSELTGSIVGLAAGLALALVWHNALALLAGQAAASLTTIALCVARSQQADHDGPLTRWQHLLPFATTVSAQNFVYYVIYNLPPLAISRTMGASALGFFSRANVLVSLPLSQLTQAVSRTLYPLWARRSGSEQIREPLTDVLVGSSLIGCAGFGLLFAAATPITRLLLGPSFAGVEDLIRILAVFGVLNLQLSIAGSVQESHRWMSDVWRLQGVKLAVSALLLLTPVVRDVRFAAWVLVLGQLVAHAWQVVQLRRRRVLATRRLAGAYLQHTLLVLPPVLLLWGLTVLLDGLLAQVLVALVVSGATALAILALGARLEGVQALLRRGMIPTPLERRLSRSSR